MSKMPVPANHKPLLRKKSNTKPELKEKFVQIYEAFFKGYDSSKDKPNFWDELFLLKVNLNYLDNAFGKLNGEQLMALKENINLLFYKCIETLKQNHPIRIVNALQTLCGLISGVFKKSHGDYGFDTINVLMGFDAAEARMQSMIESVHRHLTGDGSNTLKSVCLKLLLVLVTAADNVSQNTVLEYVMINSVFEAITQILANPLSRKCLGHNAVLLLAILVQYRKHESANPYIVKLSILDDEMALTGFAQIVATALAEFNRQYKTKLNEVQTQGGFFATLTNMMGSMFVAEDAPIEAVRANDSILLALYEACHLNRNFITTLTHSHTASSQSSSPPVTPTTPEEASAPASPTVASQEPVHSADQPSNLLVTFLEYSSIIMQDVREETRLNNAKLCLIILTCIAEDQYGNSMMHDVNMNFRVLIHKAPMRHRRASIDHKRLPSRPIASSLLDLMVEFISSHMMKNMPFEIHLRCLGIIHRVLCYQKKCRVRLQYTWKDVWTAMINLLKFVLANETSLAKHQHNIILLCSRVTNIFNLFITYGDTFLPNPSSYDELYYELIRMHTVFDNLYSMALRYTSIESEWKEPAGKLTNHLVNIRAIVNHFTPKVDSWATVNHLSTLTEDQVLEVVRSNYDTLTLKLQENLDQFERYTEKPRETAFFSNLVRSILSDVRYHVTHSNLQQDHAVLQELSTIK